MNQCGLCKNNRISFKRNGTTLYHGCEFEGLTNPLAKKCSYFKSTVSVKAEEACVRNKA
jgi:hypothetical protein